MSNNLPTPVPIDQITPIGSITVADCFPSLHLEPKISGYLLLILSSILIIGLVHIALGTIYLIIKSNKEKSNRLFRRGVIITMIPVTIWILMALSEKLFGFCLGIECPLYLGISNPCVY